MLQGSNLQHIYIYRYIEVYYIHCIEYLDSAVHVKNVKVWKHVQTVYTYRYRLYIHLCVESGMKLRTSLVILKQHLLVNVHNLQVQFTSFSCQKGGRDHPFQVKSQRRKSGAPRSLVAPADQPWWTSGYGHTSGDIHMHRCRLVTCGPKVQVGRSTVGCSNLLCGILGQRAHPNEIRIGVARSRGNPWNPTKGRT